VWLLSAESEPVTFTGNSYARYTLVGDTSSRKRQVDMEMAFYEDSVSISVQTTQQAGLVYWMGGATDYAALEVSRMCAVCTIRVVFMLNWLIQSHIDKLTL